jgi:hypothetical protein
MRDISVKNAKSIIIKSEDLPSEMIEEEEKPRIKYRK